MSGSVNKVIIVGTLGADPKIKSVSNGNVAHLSVATSESWKDKNGEKVEKTEWHRATCFGKLTDICEKYLTKGSQVYLEGRLETRKWQDKDGQDKYNTEIVVANMVMLGGKRKESTTTPQTSPEDFDDEFPF